MHELLSVSLHGSQLAEGCGQEVWPMRGSGCWEIRKSGISRRRLDNGDEIRSREPWASWNMKYRSSGTRFVGEKQL